jgi:hypothetical protein
MSSVAAWTRLYTVGLYSMYGPIKPQYAARLARLLERPSDETWDACHGIIVSRQSALRVEGCRPTPSTIWQWVLFVDPTFTRFGPTTVGNKPRPPWPQVPDEAMLREALRCAQEYNRAANAGASGVLRLDSFSITSGQPRRPRSTGAQ